MLPHSRTRSDGTTHQRKEPEMPDKENQALTTSPSKPLQTLTKKQKNEHIAMLVAQSFHIFNRYGKQNDAIPDTTRAFIDDLSEFDADEITAGFKAWRKYNDGMPTPSGIIKEINKTKIARHAREKTLSDFDGDWSQYKQYLDQKGLLNEKTIENKQRTFSVFYIGLRICSIRVLVGCKG